MTMYRDVGECWVGRISTGFSFLSVGRPAIIPFRNLLSVFLFPLLFYFPHLAVTSLVFIPSRPVFFLFFFIVRYMYMYMYILDQLRSILHCPPSGRYVLFLPTKHKLRLLFSRLNKSFGRFGKLAAQFHSRNNIATTFEL